MAATAPGRSLIASSRVRWLSKETKSGKSVVYVMARDQRVADNHALSFGAEYAQKRQLPFAVVFCLQRISQSVAREHYDFMLAGLKEVEADLKRKNIAFLLLIGPPLDTLSFLFTHVDPSLVIFDANPLRGPRHLHRAIAKKYPTRAVVEIDTHNCVPTRETYPKQAPKQHNLWPGTVMTLRELDTRINAHLKDVKSNGAAFVCTSGEKAAHKYLRRFIARRLKGYATHRRDPAKCHVSGLSPYLHYGQLSSLQVMSACQKALENDPSLQGDVNALFEEMVMKNS